MSIGTLQSDFTEYPIIAYNLPFDKDVLIKTLNYLGEETPEMKGACALNLARNNIKGLENYKLSTVCKHLNIELNHHDPESDARATAEIVIHIVKNMIAEDESLSGQNQKTILDFLAMCFHFCNNQNQATQSFDLILCQH